MQLNILKLLIKKQPDNYIRYAFVASEYPDIWYQLMVEGHFTLTHIINLK